MFLVSRNINFLLSEGSLNITTDTATGFLTSHEDYNFRAGSSYNYQNKPLQLTMNIPSASTKLRIKYISFVIGNVEIKICQEENTKEDTSKDQFSIHNGNTLLYGCGGGKDTPSDNIFDIISHMNTLHFQLKVSSSSAGYPGFLMKYEGKQNYIFIFLSQP